MSIKDTNISLNIKTPWHCIETDNQSILVFCTEQCLNSYTISVLAEDEGYATIKQAPNIECVYCHWCAIRVHKPEICFTHSNNCPDTSWKYSYQALECYHELFQLFFALNLSIPAEVFNDVEDIAAMYGPDLPGRAIARIAYKAWDFFQ